MYVPRSNLDFKFLKDVKMLEEKYQLSILFEYKGDVCFAHCYSLEFELMEIAEIRIGTRDDSKERWYINLSKELKRRWS